MADVRGIVEGARRETHEIEARLKTHPYLAALEVRRIANERLRHFAEQRHHIIESDLRSVALAAARAGSPRTREFFLRMLQGQGAAAAALGALARGLRMAPEATASAEPLAVITEGLERGVDPRRTQRAARLLQGYELLYWNTLHQASST